MGSWLPKLPSRDMKTKNKEQKKKKKDQPTHNHKKQCKIKAMRTLRPTMDHYPKNG